MAEDKKQYFMRQKRLGPRWLRNNMIRGHGRLINSIAIACNWITGSPLASNRQCAISAAAISSWYSDRRVLIFHRGTHN
ncbi:hypothetical protein Agabi119p4_9532 [Agaricus bisporus var. burnettii]|uniref:Uncharacterized protein n=1 Tax=Agaricus bisporus var. burnettii TaxID=192524 RepID=A0A8H7C3T8_AGABI|nr:hypothetical protein Agabi119p4_9532 [Agaricus bisporus var. burnettii]